MSLTIPCTAILAIWNVTCRGWLNDLGAEPTSFFPEAGQRPMRDSLGQCQRPHEVGEL